MVQKLLVDGSLETVGYTFYLKEPIDKKLRTPEMVLPSVFALLKSEPLFQREFS